MASGFPAGDANPIIPSAGVTDKTGFQFKDLPGGQSQHTRKGHSKPGTLKPEGADAVRPQTQQNPRSTQDSPTIEGDQNCHNSHDVHDDQQRHLNDEQALENSTGQQPNGGLCREQLRLNGNLRDLINGRIDDGALSETGATRGSG